jgi:hypothetical protein
MASEREAAEQIAGAVAESLTTAIRRSDIEDVIESEIEDLGLVQDELETARRVVDEENITTTDYFAFRSAMLENGVDDDGVSEIWDELRDEGAIPSGTRPDQTSESGSGSGSGGASDTGESSDPSGDLPFADGDDILLTMQETDASEKTAMLLSDSIMNEEIKVATAQSEIGEQILKPLDPGKDLALPMHVVYEDGTFSVGDLEGLFERYLSDK